MTDFRQKQRDFLDFLQSQAADPPPQLDQAVSVDMQIRMRREGPKAIGKFLVCHFIAAMITLSFCPQFGLGPYFADHISHYFMTIGTWACALYCSAVFFGVGLLVSRLSLNLNESRRLARIPWYLATVYCFGVLVLFLVIGDRSHEQQMFFEAEFIAIWFLSGLMILLVGLYTGGSQSSHQKLATS